MIVDIDSIRKSTRFQAGFVEAIVDVGHKIGDNRFELSDQRAKELFDMYRIKKTFGLGDLISSVATPIASALNLPCIDQETRQLRPESPCAKRKAALNRIQLPFIGTESNVAHPKA